MNYTVIVITFLDGEGNCRYLKAEVLDRLYRCYDCHLVFLFVEDMKGHAKLVGHDVFQTYSLNGELLQT